MNNAPVFEKLQWRPVAQCLRRYELRDNVSFPRHAISKPVANFDPFSFLSGRHIFYFRTASTCSLLSS